MTLTCPTRDHLTQFLDNRLSPIDEESLSRHLETCPQCVSAMEELTASGSTPSDGGATRSFRPSSRSPLPASELSRLKQFLPPARTPAPRAEREFPHLPGYEIECELGRGGMGIVYLARQTQLNRRVALKMILAGAVASQEQIIRFLAEAQTCASLHHDNIVQIFEVGQHAGTPFYSMEYVPGGTLADRMRRQPPSPHEAAEIVEQLARAMHAAHKKGIIHRDLKPVNVLVREPLATDENGGVTRTFGPGAFTVETKITDFGLAKNFELGTGLTNTGAILGTPDYMAPEQVASGEQRVGPAADIHALGAILYYLIAGRPPFAASTPLETLALVKDTDPVSPSQLNRNVPRDLSVICLRCLEKQPNRRYGSAEALADDLNRFRRGQPITARPVTEFERIWKWARRNPVVATLSASLAAMVLVALGLVSWQLSVASAQRNAEAKRADEEAVARAVEAKARHAAQLLSAGYALDQGIQDCRAGRIDVGIESMIRALEILPADEPDMEFAIRANLGAWREQLCPGSRTKGHGTAVVSAAASADGERIVVGNWGNVLGNQGPAFIKMWDANRFTDEPLWTAAHPMAVWSVAFSPDGRNVAGGGFDGTVTVRDAATGKERFPALPHSGCVFTVAFSPDGKLLAVGGGTTTLEAINSGTGEVRFWNALTGEAVGEPVPLPFRVSSLAWHPGGASLAVGGVHLAKPDSGTNGVAAILDRATSKLREPILTHGDSVGAVAFHPQGHTLVTGCRDGLIRFWDSATLKPIRTSDSLPKTLRLTQPVTSVQFDPSGEMIATASGHHSPGARAGLGEVIVWDAASGKPILAPQFERVSSFSQKMHAVSFGGGGKRLTAACEHGAAWSWTLPPLRKPNRSFSYEHRADIHPAPGGKHVLHRLMPPAVRGFNEMPCEIRIVEAETGRTIAALPHRVVVQTRFRPDGARFFTFTSSESPQAGVWLWETATGANVPLPPEFGARMMDIRFAADGNTIHTIHRDGSHRVWDAATLLPIREAKPCLDPGELVAAISEDCTRLVAYSTAGTRLVALEESRFGKNLDTGSVHPERVASGGMPVFHATFARSGRVVTNRIGADESILAWNGGDGLKTGSAPGNWILRARFADDRQFLLSTIPEGNCRTWDSESGTLGASDIPLKGKVAIHPGGKLFASTQTGTAAECQLFGLAGKPIGPAYPHGLLNDVEFSLDGRTLITAGSDFEVKLWPIPTPLTGSPAELRSRR